jgi:hypothetical protein
MGQDSRGAIGVVASLVTILGFFGLRTIYDFFPKDESASSSSEASASPSVSAEAGGNHAPFRETLEPASPAAQERRSDVTGQLEDRVPFLWNGEAPEVTVAMTFSLMPRTVTGCLRIPQGFTHFAVDGLPPVPIRIFIQCTDSTNGVAITRYSPVQPSSVRFENPSDTEVGFIKISPR